MTRPLILLATFLAGAAGTQEQQPLFRSGTELVRVDVLVTDDGAPVTGLTAADFEVRDKGVRQRVTSAGAVAAVQLGVVLDVSGSMTGERLAIARSATIDLLSRLTRGDKFAIVAFGDQVGRVTAPGATVAEAAEGLDRMRAGGATALLDGTYAGILESDGGPGPKLLLVMTDGRNNASWLPANAVIDAARRHETVIYPVAVDINAWWDYRIVRQSLTERCRGAAEDDGGRDRRTVLQGRVEQQPRRDVPADPARIPPAVHPDVHAGGRGDGRRLAPARGEGEAERGLGARPNAILGREGMRCPVSLDCRP